MSEQKQNLPQNETDQSSQLSNIIKNGVLYKNPVLYSALGLCPVIASGMTLKEGLALSLMLACILIPCCILASILGSKIPEPARPPLYLLFSAGLYFLAVAAVNRYFPPDMLMNLGIFAPLMAVNGIIIRRADRFASKHIVFAAILDALACAAGFALVMCITAGIREMLTFGTLLGVHVYPRSWKIPGVTLACSGFIMLGFLSAFIHALRNRRVGRQERKGRSR